MATKHRIYVTGEQIRELLMLVEEYRSEDNELLNMLKTHDFKINNGIRKADYVEKPRETTESKLGFTSNELATARKVEARFDSLPPAEKRKILFEKWQKDNDSVTFAELELVQTYRCENGLMSAEEELVYMTNMMNPHTLLPKGLIDTDSPLLDSGDSEDTGDDSVDDDTDTNT